MIDCIFAATCYDLVHKVNELKEKIEIISIVPSNKGDGYLAFYKKL